MRRLLLFLILLLTACTSAEPLPTLAPTLNAAKATAAPKVAVATVLAPVAASTVNALAPTAPAPANTAASVPIVAGAPLKGELTLWYVYEANSVDEKTFLQIVETIKKKNPELKLTLQRVAAYEAAAKYQAAAKSGGSPDILFASNDDLGDLARAQAVLDLTPFVSHRLANIAPYAIDSMKVDGKIYGVPEAANTVVLYYNKALLAKPPTTTDELLSAVKNKKMLVAVSGAYHLYGLFPAFGGRLLDDSGKCVADQGGYAEALKYLSDLKQAGATFEVGDLTLTTSFLEGKAAMFINTTWALSQYKQTLGDKLGVVPLPAAKTKAAPLVIVDGFFVNPRSKSPALAVEVALLLTALEAAQAFTTQATHVPVRTDLKVDGLLTPLLQAASEGTLWPHTKEFSNYWLPFNEMFVRVFELGQTPTEAVKLACTTMNKANNK